MQVPLHARGHVQLSLNDYQLIYKIDPQTLQRRKIRADDTVALHEKELCWLATELDFARKNGEENVIVITHHVPTMKGTSAPQYEGAFFNWTNHAFSTPLEYLFKDYARKSTEFLFGNFTFFEFVFRIR